jgi:hypothetical protein
MQAGGCLTGLETAGGPAGPGPVSLQVSSAERTTAVSWRNAARSPPRPAASSLASSTLWRRRAWVVLAWAA